MPLRIDPARTPRGALFWVVVGASFALVSFAMPITPIQRYAIALLGAWLCVASAIRYAALRAESRPERSWWIPLRFSGDIGRFKLRPRGDGRRVEVRAGQEVVAEAIATDERDELVLNTDLVADSELDALGAALGQAIEMAAAADEDQPAERRVAGPRSWGRT
jgi:hypothetical protein